MKIIAFEEKQSRKVTKMRIFPNKFGQNLKIFDNSVCKTSTNRIAQEFFFDTQRLFLNEEKQRCPFVSVRKSKNRSYENRINFLKLIVDDRLSCLSIFWRLFGQLTPIVEQLRSEIFFKNNFVFFFDWKTRLTNRWATRLIETLNFVENSIEKNLFDFIGNDSVRFD